jgi:hypothetical protein
MTALFSKPPKAKKPPKPPQIDEARNRMQAEDESRRRQGRSSAVLGGASDVAPVTSSAQLLGG